MKAQRYKLGHVGIYTAYMPFFFGGRVEEIVILGSFDPHHKCLSVDGQGQATWSVLSDATQLAPLLKSFANFKGCLIEFRLKPIYKQEGLHGVDTGSPKLEKLACKG